MTISIMITTRNRSNDLHHCLKVLRGLNPQPLEFLITADGCTDDTVEMVRSEMKNGEIKNIKLIVNEVGRGSVASRDHMMREAGGDLVLTLDDDSFPQQMDCLLTLPGLFEKNPALAVATFPQKSNEYPESLTRDGFGGPKLVRFFPCSGACLRVSAYRSLRGFEPMFFHMYEETDYSIQCVENGWDILYTPAITIRHYWKGLARDELLNHHRHARNELWSTVMRCPFPLLLVMILWRLLAQARYAASRGIGWLIREPIWWFAAIKGLPQALRHRHPVSWSGYRRWLSLPGS